MNYSIIFEHGNPIKSRFVGIVILVLGIRFGLALAEPAVEFSATMSKQSFADCEDVWVYFTAKNTSDSTIDLPIPEFAAGVVEINLTAANGEIIRLGSRDHRLAPTSMNHLAIGVLPGDSVMGFVDISRYYGRPVIPTGFTFCHPIGDFSLAIEYVPLGTVVHLSYEVGHIASGRADEFREFCILDDRTSDGADDRELKMSEFLRTHPNSVYAPAVLRQKLLLHVFSDNIDYNLLRQISDECFRRFPDSPVSVETIGQLVQLQTIAENEKMLKDLSLRSGTLVAVFARQILEIAGFRAISKDSHE